MVNYLAIVVAAVASMVLAMVWYSPNVMGKMWQKLSGVKPKKEGMGKNMAGGLVTSLIMAWVLANFVSGLAMQQALTVAGWLWLGFMGTLTFGSVLWEGKPVKLWVLNNAYNLLSILVMAAILASWV